MRLRADYVWGYQRPDVEFAVHGGMEGLIAPKTAILLRGVTIMKTRPRHFQRIRPLRRRS